MDKKGQINLEDIFKLIGGIIILIILIPLVILIFQPSIFNSPDKFVQGFTSIFIPLIILGIIIEFIRRIIG